MNKTAKATIGLMIVTILSKVLGFGRELVLGSTYGASQYSDIYITALSIPTIIFSAIGAAISTTFIPLYYENYRLGGKIKSLKFTNNVLNIVVIICMILVIVSSIFTEYIVKIFAIGFTGDKLSTTINFTRIMLLGGLVTILSNIISAFLQVNKEYIVPGTIGVPFNIIIIISIILSIKINIYILPIGTLIAMFSQLIIQIPFAIKKEYKYSTILNLKDENIKKMIYLIAPVFIGVAVDQINVIVDRTIASTLIDGSISALNYSNRLNGFVFGLVITSISTVIYPVLSELSNTNKNRFIELVSNSINMVILLVIPISIGAIVLSKPIVKLLFQRGAFDLKATTMTANALIFYSIGMVSCGLREILSKIFYSLKDTSTPMKSGIISICINIILNIILVRYIGYLGLAFATSISSIICTIILLKKLKDKVGYFGEDKIFTVAFKSIISSIVMGIIVFIIYKLLSYILDNRFIYQIISLSISVFAGSIVYYIALLVLKVDEVNIFKEKITKYISNTKIYTLYVKNRRNYAGE